MCAVASARAGITCYNLGVRRDTSQDILLRWQAECAVRLPSTCDGRIVVSCGVNDTMIENGRPRIAPQQSCANLRQILLAAGRYQRLMVGPPPLGDPAHDARIHALSRAYAREAEALAVPYIDLFSALSADADYIKEVQARDGAHPASTGYAKMAGIIAASPAWWFHTP